MPKLLIANWKQNKTLKEITEWFDVFAQKYQPKEGVQVIICPPTCYLQAVSDQIKQHGLKNVSCGAQDISVYVGGSHTGEVSASQVKDFCAYSVVGHSERSEQQEVIMTKAENCLANGLTPLVCLRSAESFRITFPADAILVWEDPSNISANGAFKNISASGIAKTAQEIKGLTDSNRLLVYGGSVNENNVSDLEQAGLFAGYLLGHASLDPVSFTSVFERLTIL